MVFNYKIKDYGGWKMDISLFVLLMVAKICLFAWSYTDGFRNEKEMNACLYFYLKSLTFSFRLKSKLIKNPSFVL